VRRRFVNPPRVQQKKAVAFDSLTECNSVELWELKGSSVQKGTEMRYPVKRAALVIALFAAGTMVEQAPAQATPGTTQEQTAASGRSAIASQLGVFVYPKNQQSQAQQTKDENECYNSAKQQSGVDPAAPPPPPQEAQKAKGGGAKGAAGGAAGGAAVGAIAGDAGTGAAVGATAGAVRGRRQQKKANKQAEQQAEQKTQAQQQQALATFKNAFSACMDARQYSVK
jgi:hypothetical protein